MGNPSERSLVSKAAHKGSSLAARFFVRWLVWTLILGAVASVVAQLSWPHVYEKFGLPLGIGREDIYKAVEYGVLVTSVFGGASVGLVGTFFPR